jgi:hypothetical protein
MNWIKSKKHMVCAIYSYLHNKGALNEGWIIQVELFWSLPKCWGFTYLYLPELGGHCLWQDK